MTSTTDNDTAKIHRIDGWEAPAWATEHERNRLDSDDITWRREGASILGRETSAWSSVISSRSARRRRGSLPPP